MLFERKLTERELDHREVVLQNLLRNKRNLVKKYGKDAEKVMYGIATKKAKKKIEQMNLDNIKELVRSQLQGEAVDSAPRSSTVDFKSDKSFSGGADYGSEVSANTAEDNTEVGELQEGHGLDQGDIDFLQSFVDRMGYNKEPVDAKEFSKLKKILQSIIKTNIKPGDMGQSDINENLIKEFIEGPLGKRNDVLFDKLVPSSGDSETVEGELIRAINRIIYRWFNDGDYFYQGYGIETAGGAHSFLINSKQIPFDLQSTLTSIFNKAEGAPEDGYERLIKFALEKVVDHVEATPEDEYTKLDRGMFDFEPEYEEDLYDEEEDDDYYDEYEDEEEYLNEKEDVDRRIKAQNIVKKILKDEGGAAGLKPIVAALKKLKFSKDELIKLLKKTVGVVKHRHGDYILKPIEEGTCGYDRDENGTKLNGPGGLGEDIKNKIDALVREKLTKKSDVGDFVDDFKKSDAKQFKGKSAKKKKEMAVAAYLAKQNDK